MGRLEVLGSEIRRPTPPADVNQMLGELQVQVQTILGSHFVGMYLSGSLALGDFNPHTSDIDLVIVTDAPVSDDCFVALQVMHGRLAAGGSGWGTKLEAVYIPRAALCRAAPTGVKYPVLERGCALVRDHLEPAWSVHCHTLREHGVAVAGPEPRTLVDPVDPDEMRRAGAVIAGTWLEEANTDLSWLAWLRQRKNQAFVVLTLCRLLFTLDTGTVATKPGAVRWATQAIGPRWHGLIERALAGQGDSTEVPDGDADETVALIQHTVDRFRAWESSVHG